MARLLSVNVGLPREVEWKERSIRTGIWKNPVAGRCRVRRLNLEGDGQGDLAGHGGEQRAVLVYQMHSYQYWRKELGRTLVDGQFGENFTVEGLADNVVCIGDRYQIGSALFEVTQPRVTCYRLGIRLDEPRMPALLTSRGRPGFYLRVLQEGEVGAGDAIVKVGESNESMTVAEVNALLYFPDHPIDQLRRAVRIDALSRGWRSSFEALLQNRMTIAASGNVGLAPASARRPAAPGFRPLSVTAIDHESADVVSLSLSDPDGSSLAPAEPGQYLVLRLPRTAVGASLFRSYSLSGPPSTDRYRISIKIEPKGAAGNYVREHVRVGDILDASLPRGNFVLQAAERPVVLLSAGIGATPVLAMLYALASVRSVREILWLHGARSRQQHPFAMEVRRLIQSLPRGRSYISYSKPDPTDKPHEDFDGTGHLSPSVLEAVGVPPDADIYICGPSDFMEAMANALASKGVRRDRIYRELFNGGESKEPGVVSGPTRTAHAPSDDADTGPLVSFARSGVAAHWKSSYQSILELAEACDVKVRWSCRAGVCHNCESGLVSGAIAYAPEPLDSPAEGNLLICCARPIKDVVVDL
jgi:ferredoxin-NADP reductase/MOSC domain-containing protein YiiM